MALNRIRARAEKEAVRIIDDVRERIIGKVGSASKLKGFEGKNLRDDVRRAIEAETNAAKTRLTEFMQEAWDEGVRRAGVEVEADLVIKASALRTELDSFEEVIERAFRSLSTDIETATVTLLQRGAVTNKELTEVLDKLKSKSYFRQFKARAAGIITEELVQIEAYAHGKRAREIARTLSLTEKALGPAAVRTKRKDTDKEVLVMHVWKHSGGGNPPRQNHIEMNDKAVVKGHKFILKTRDGSLVKCTGPKDPDLPDGELYNCHCRFVQKVLFVTPQERAKIERESLATGGFTDARWAL